jgi:hypothetical protein
VQQSAPAYLVCSNCGSVPAVNTSFHSHLGVVIVMQTQTMPGPFCRDCGLGVFRNLTSQTLVTGWWGILSVFITPVTILMNLIGGYQVSRLAAPRPNPYGPSRPPMYPGASLLRRPMTWFGLAIPVVLLTLFIVALNTPS